MTVEINNDNHKPRGKRIKHKKLIIVLSVILVVALLLVSAYFILINVGKSKLKKDSGNAKLPTINSESVLDDADAYHNGQAYNYNDDLVNILLIGVDNNNPDLGSKHQADALYLLSLNPSENTLNVVAISRNTVTQVDSYDMNGEYFATVKQQICLAYTYSSDNKKASENTVKAVSDFLYGVPISGYYTVFMDSLSDIINAVGGVPVHINEDMTRISSTMYAGADVTITGDNVLSYLRFRNDSNVPRLERHKTFISSFMSRAKTACLKDLSLPLKMYNKLAANTVTDVTAASAVYLASEALDSDFKIVGIEGTAGNDGTYETFIPDEDKLYNLLLDVFYKKQ